MADRRTTTRRQSPGRRDEDEAVVTFSVREILGRIEEKQTEGFAKLTQALVEKADKSDVVRLETRLDNHATRIDKLEDVNHDRDVRAQVHHLRDERSSVFKTKWGKALAGVAMVVATIGGPYLGAHIHF